MCIPISKTFYSINKNSFKNVLLWTNIGTITILLAVSMFCIENHVLLWWCEDVNHKNHFSLQNVFHPFIMAIFLFPVFTQISYQPARRHSYTFMALHLAPTHTSSHILNMMEQHSKAKKTCYSLKNKTECSSYYGNWSIPQELHSQVDGKVLWILEWLTWYFLSK